MPEKQCQGGKKTRIKERDCTMDYTVRDKVFPAFPGDTKMGGMSKKSADTFLYERVLSDYAKDTVFGEATDAFREQLDGEGAAGLWRGEFWGKLMLSAVETAKYTGDAELRRFIEDKCLELISLARDDGYIGTYRISTDVFSRDPRATFKIMGWKCDWNWNIWCRKYTLWGLVAGYGLTKNKKILDGAVGVADQLIGELDRMGVHILRTGTFGGVASGSVMKPMLELYGYTGDKKYLEFAKKIADGFEDKDVTWQTLITYALEKKPCGDWHRGEGETRRNKAYETMSCFEGIAELYRYTGVEKYKTACENFYDILVKHELNRVFSVGFNDLFDDAAKEINVISEPCDAIHFMRFCFELYKLTGEAKYMDSFELCYHNAFLAGVFRDGKWGARGVRGAGRHMYAVGQAQTKYQHCCVNNMPRALVRMTESAVMKTEDAVVVNLYEEFSSSVSFGDGKALVSIKKGYFEEGRTEISVTFEGEPKRIRLRIPAWSKKTSVECGGKVFDVPAGYFDIAPEQYTGKTAELVLVTDISPRLVAFINPVPKHAHDDSDWKYRRFIEKTTTSGVPDSVYLDSARCTLMCGALLMARSKRIGNTEEEMFDGTLIPAGAAVKAKAVEDENVRIRRKVTFICGGKEYVTDVCDYASAANEKHDEDDRFFSIYF